MHELQDKWDIFFIHKRGRLTNETYAPNLTKVCTFGTVEEFWSVYSRLKRPTDLPKRVDMQVFKTGISPMWEDPMNMNGGEFVLRVKRIVSGRLFEKMLLGVIGNILKNVCGVVLNLRNSEDVLMLWNSDATIDIEQMKLDILELLEVPSDTRIQYTAHSSHLQSLANQ